MIHVAVNVQNDVWSKAYISGSSPFCPDLDHHLELICTFCGLMVCIILFPFIYNAICTVLYNFVSNLQNHDTNSIIQMIALMITVLIYFMMGYFLVECHESKNTRQRNIGIHSTRWNTHIQKQTNTTQDFAVEITRPTSSGQIEI